MHWSVYVLVGLVFVVVVVGLSGDEVVLHDADDLQTNIIDCCQTSDGLTCAVVDGKDCSLCQDYCS